MFIFNLRITYFENFDNNISILKYLTNLYLLLSVYIHKLYKIYMFKQLINVNSIKTIECMHAFKKKIHKQIIVKFLTIKIKIEKQYKIVKFLTKYNNC